MSIATQKLPVQSARAQPTAGMVHRAVGTGERLHYIDGLRAVAIVLVMAHHFATGTIGVALVDRGWNHLGTGLIWSTNSGVELFFVLSGVILVRPYLRGARRFDWRRYARRRIARLWPPFLASWVFAGAVVLSTTISPTWYDILPRFTMLDWIRQVGMVNAGWPIYNLAWWSLTPEIAFYLCVPALVAFIVAGRRPASRAIMIATAAAVASVVFYTEASRPGVPDGFLNAARQFLAYSPCFFAGVVLAATVIKRHMAVVLLGFGVVYLLMVLELERANVHIAFALLYTGLVATSHTTIWLRRTLDRPLMVWLGERSYSFYLIHFSALYLSDAVAAHVFPSRTLGYYLSTRISAGVITLALGMILFWLVERRFAHNLLTRDAFWPWRKASMLHVEPLSV